jgi:hypothetical protein
MSTLYVELKDLKPGEKYSFEAPSQGPGRVQGTFDKAVGIPGINKTQYMFFDMLSQKGEPNGRYNFVNPDTYPRNIIHLPLNRAPTTPPDYGIRPPLPPGGRGGKSRKNKKSKKNRKLRKNKKSKRRNRKSYKKI